VLAVSIELWDSMPPSLINVSNRLPVTVEENRITKSSGGLVAALEGQYTTKWIGWPGATFPETEPPQEVERILPTKQPKPAKFILPLDQTLFQGHPGAI
jgi:trehalose-6-phosphate synthase